MNQDQPSPDAIVSASQFIQALPGAIDKIASLDRWIAQRIDEVKQVETRIDSRLEKLAKAEEALTRLMDAVRKQVADSMPVLGQLSEARKRVEGTAHQVMAGQAPREPAMDAAQQPTSPPDAPSPDGQLEDRLVAAAQSLQVETDVTIARIRQSMSQQAEHMEREGRLVARVRGWVEQNSSALSREIARLEDAAGRIERLARPKSAATPQPTPVLYLSEQVARKHPSPANPPSLASVDAA